MSERLMSVREAAEYLNVSEVNLRKRIRQGKLPAFFKVGELWRVKREDLLKQMGRD